METFEFSVEVGAEPERVLRAFWELEDWPSVAPHVREIVVHYGDENAQVLTMHVLTRGRHDRFKSVRYKQRDTIYYFQPDPPPILNSHHGCWRVTRDEGGGSVVTSRHTIDVNVEAAAGALGSMGERPGGGDDETRKQVQALIRNNSLQTMLALKARLEGEEGGGYEEQEISKVA